MPTDDAEILADGPVAYWPLSGSLIPADGSVHSAH